jgi:DNA polymerase-3 subunit epsilon
MNIALVYDTETTGLPDKTRHLDDHRQPHIVQLAARMIDLDTRAIIQTLDVIIQPFGWKIPPETVKIHGISQELGDDVGVPEGNAVDLFYDLWKEYPRIAHNEPFDAEIIAIALSRYLEEEMTAWAEGEAHCTAKLATPILDLPPTERMIATGRNHPKTPNLSEAYKFFTGADLIGAHSDLTDVDACLAVWWAIQDRMAGDAS